MTKREIKYFAVRVAFLTLQLSPVARSHAVLGTLDTLTDVLTSTAQQEFGGYDRVFAAAWDWEAKRVRKSGRRGPYLACATYRNARGALSKLIIQLGKAYVQRVSNSPSSGTCFIVTASPAQGRALTADLASNRLVHFVILPSALKLVPGLLDHETVDSNLGQLSTTRGYRMLHDNVAGLKVELSPGIFIAHDPAVGPFIDDLRGRLMSSALDLYSATFWADKEGAAGHLLHPAGELRIREWTRVADVVHGRSREEGGVPGTTCSWNKLVLQSGSGTIVITGMDHLLHFVEVEADHQSDELQMACLMGLISVLAATPEVLRISPLHKPEVLNAVAASIIQSASSNTSHTPLREAGLDGTGEVIQIIDTGLDETSCFFVDHDGLEVEHGYYFDEMGFKGDVGMENVVTLFSGGYFPFDLSRRKVVQYIRLVRPAGVGSQSSSFSTSNGRVYPWYSESGFGEDLAGGHGTHTAGSAAGAALTEPAETATCSGTDTLGCLGECLNQTYLSALLDNEEADWDTWCTRFDCDNFWTDDCLAGDVAQTLTENGGMAQGAKLAIFDASFDGLSIWVSLVGNDLWRAAEGTGCLVHSNSWGGYSHCTVDAECIMLDEYMYENPEHLLIFAAGNDGAMELEDAPPSCTIASPAIAKNVLAVGASSSGPDRLTVTSDEDGNPADIDTVAFFSSYGFTRDDRIKPELLAPGDTVLSASSDGADGTSCVLNAQFGTSMAAPIVAGAAAMVRQYFNDENFYEHDVRARGFCDSLSDVNATNTFTCDSFSPSAATVKAMLVNGANLMGGSAEPDELRGFGRIHMETVLPLNGEGNMGLFVMDSSSASLGDYTIDEYSFHLHGSAGLELRATLAWIDPPASSTSSVQLVHDLDLTVTAPTGAAYRMWSTGADDRNVIERVIVPAGSIGQDGGTWVVAVSSAGVTDTQPYSLVVTGPFDDESGAGTTRTYSSSLPRARGTSAWAVAAAVASTIAIARSAV